MRWKLSGGVPWTSMTCLSDINRHTQAPAGDVIATTLYVLYVVLNTWCVIDIRPTVKSLVMFLCVSHTVEPLHRVMVQVV